MTKEDVEDFTKEFMKEAYGDNTKEQEVQIEEKPEENPTDIVINEENKNIAKEWFDSVIN